MSGGIKLTTIEGRNNKKFDVYVTAGGTFYTNDVPGAKTFGYPTIDELCKHVDTLTRKAQVRIKHPVSLLSNGHVRKATLTGQHQGTGKLLVTIHNEQFGDVREQIDGYRDLSRRLTDEESAQYKALCDAARTAQVARDAFVKSVSLDGRKLVHAAQVAAGAITEDK